MLFLFLISVHQVNPRHPRSNNFFLIMHFQIILIGVFEWIPRKNYYGYCARRRRSALAEAGRVSDQDGGGGHGFLDRHSLLTCEKPIAASL
jgi:hypothetical protein